MNVEDVLRVAQVFFTGEAAAINEASRALDAMCNEASVIGVCAEALKGSGYDENLVFLLLQMLKLALGRVPGLQDPLPYIQSLLIPMLDIYSSAGVRELLSWMICETMNRTHFFSDELRAFLASENTSREYFEILMCFVLLNGVDEDLTQTIHARIAHGLNHGRTTLERLFALYFLVNFSKNVLKSQALIEEFKDKFIELFREAVVNEVNEPLEIFFRLFLRYDAFIAPYLPFAELINCLSSTELPPTNLLSLRDFVSSIFMKQPRGTYSEEVTRGILSQMVALSIHLLAWDSDPSLSTGSHFVPILMHVNESQAVDMVMSIISGMPDKDTFPCSCTILALIDGLVSCCGYFDCVGEVLNKAFETQNVDITKCACNIVCDHIDLLRPYVIDNADRIITTVCCWARAPFRDGSGNVRGDFCYEPLHVLLDLLMSLPQIPMVDEVMNVLVVFFPSDQEFEVVFALKILSILVKRRAVRLPDIENFVRVVAEMKLRGNHSIQRHAAATLVEMCAIDPNFMAQLITPDFLQIDSIVGVNFVIRILAIYRMNTEMSHALLPFIAQNIQQILDGIDTEVKQSDDIVEMAMTCQTISLLMLLFPDQIERAWGCFTASLAKILPPASDSAQGVKVAHQALILIYECPGILQNEQCVATLEDVLWKCVSSVIESNVCENSVFEVMTELNNLLKQHVRVVGASRSVTALIKEDLEYCKLYLTDEKYNTSVVMPFLVSAKQFFANVMRSTELTALANDLTGLALSTFQAHRDNPRFMGIVFQFCYIAELYGPAIRDEELLLLTVNYIRDGEEEVAISAAEFLFAVSETDPETFETMQEVVRQICVERLQVKGIDSELSNYLVALMVALPEAESTDIVLRYLIPLPHQRTYQRIYGWIIEQLVKVQDETKIVLLVRPIIFLFALNLERCIGKGYLTREVVCDCSRVLSKIEPELLRRVIKLKEEQFVRVQKNIAAYVSTIL